MADVNFRVHVRYAPDFGPVSRFVPPTLQIQENADSGGGKPTEPKALAFSNPETGETDVFILSEQTRALLVKMLTGGIVLPGIEAA